MSATSMSQAALSIVQVCHKHPDGMQLDVLEKELMGTPKEQVVAALNELMKCGKLVHSRGGDKKLVFRLQSDADAQRFQQLTVEDRLIYQEIQKSGANGISSKVCVRVRVRVRVSFPKHTEARRQGGEHKKRVCHPMHSDRSICSREGGPRSIVWYSVPQDLRVRSNLQQQQLTKVLKTLELRKLVRSVKSISAKNKKLYMLIEMEPSNEVTGGAWYSDAQEFDHELIQHLQQQSINFIAREEGATAQQVADFVRESGLVRGKPLKLEDIRSILESLVYDARLEVARDAYTGKDDDALYRLINLETCITKYSCVPCAVCPVFNDCHDEGDISPSKCEYLTTWLERTGDFDLSW